MEAVEIADRHVADFAPRGYIGLQNHDEQNPVYFRNIYVKDLS